MLVTWNSERVLPACLHGLASQGVEKLIAVDNSSTDDSVACVQASFPSALVIRNDVNRGFSAACNQGIAACTTPYILFVNDDAVLGRGYTRKLVEALERAPRAASAVGKLRTNVRGTWRIDSAGIAMRRWNFTAWDRGHHEPDRGQFDRPELIFGPSAAAALYRMAALQQVGPEVFDEHLFAYYEDVDLAWRLNRAGWTHLYEPAVDAVHTRRGPERHSHGTEAIAFGNRYLVWIKNESFIRFATYAPVGVLWEGARILRRAYRRPWILTAFPRAFALAPAMLRKRWHKT